MSSKGEIRAGKLAGRSLGSAIWILAAPILVQQLMQAGVGMADKVFAGQLPASERIAGLDAIGIGSYVGWFIGIAMAGLGIGGQALIARAMGSGDLRLGRDALGQAIGLCVGWGVLVGAGLWLSAQPMASVCRLSPEAAAAYVEYIRILALGMPFAGIMIVGAMCLHGAGETTKPSVIAVIVNLVNVVASWALAGVDITTTFGGVTRTFENPVAIDLGVQGIAGGTAIGYLVGAVLTLLVLRRGVRDLELSVATLRFHPGLAWRLARIGLPNFMEGISMWAVNLFVLMFIGTIAERSAAGAGGAGLQGAHIIAVQWEAFSFLPGFAIGTAAAALAGQYLGAGNPEMAKRSIVVCTLIAAVLMGLLGIVFVVFGEALTRIVSSEPVHLEMVPRLLDIAGVVQVAFATTMVVRQGLRGVGDTKWTFLITTISSYGVRLPAAWFLGVHLEMGLVGIWYALCGEFVIRALLFTARLRNGGWTRIRV